MDKALRNTIIAAVSNLSTAYNLSVISIVQVIVENQYCGGPKGCKAEADVAATSCLVGAIFGQLTFGYVGDCLGRSRALQLTMAMSILGALASAFAVPFDSSNPPSIFYFLALSRFFLGIGVGGVYPLSATIASESSASQASRGRTASIVFSMQGIANLLVPVIALALVQMPDGNGNASSPDDLGLSWRLCLGLGGLPGILLAPFKATETQKKVPAPTAVTEVTTSTNSTPDTAAEHVRMTLGSALTSRKYIGKIIGFAGGWFLFDITFYGNGLFQAPVLAAIFDVQSNSTNHFTPIGGDVAHNRALQMMFIAGIALPGYYVSVCFMDSLGRRAIQLQGFFFMTLAFGTLGLAFDALPAALLLLLYGLTFFFSNFGPNSTTFILPSETFPPEVRTTLNGFSAAAGKAGAALGSSLFTPFNDLYGLPHTMLACASVALLGFIVTYFFVEDRRKSGMEGEAAQDEESEAVGLATADSAAART